MRRSRWLLRKLSRSGSDTDAGEGDKRIISLAMAADTQGWSSEGVTGVVKEYFKPAGPKGKLRLQKLSKPFEEGRLDRPSIALQCA